MTQETATKTRKRKRERSPNYPGIDIEQALRRANQLYGQERKYAAPVKTILEHWGYGENSGQGLVVLAALKRFGLLIEEGTGASRKGRLSDDALAILQDQRPDSVARQMRIKGAALRPPIHRELWDKYKTSLPSDPNLLFELQHEKGFSEGGATEFLKQYRRTLEVADLTEHDKLSEEHEDKPPDDDEDLNMTPPTTAEGFAAVTVGVAPGKFAHLRAPIPMTESQWEQMIKGLEAQKPGFLAPDEKE